MPELQIRCVNAADPITLQPSEKHPHGLPSKDFDAIFAIIFGHHSLADSPLDVSAN
jgi:xylulose-5-phosphate/fructose-6-phosphate phosphoketolase